MVVITHYAPLPQHTSPQQPKTQATSVSAWTARIWLWWACPHAFWVTLCVARTATLVTFSRTGQHVEPGQRSTIRAASPLSQHVTPMPPTGLQPCNLRRKRDGAHGPHVQGGCDEVIQKFMDRRNVNPLAGGRVFMNDEVVLI